MANNHEIVWKDGTITHEVDGKVITETYQERIQRAINNIEVFEEQLIKVEEIYRRYGK